MKKKPFNREAALAGKKVVTGDDREVTGLHLFEGVTNVFSLAGVLDGCINRWTELGKFGNLPELTLEDSECDLFMAPETVTMWVNVYLNRGKYNTGFTTYTNKETAKSKAELNNYHDTVPITIEI